MFEQNDINRVIVSDRTILVQMKWMKTFDRCYFSPSFMITARVETMSGNEQTMSGNEQKGIHSTIIRQA